VTAALADSHAVHGIDTLDGDLRDEVFVGQIVQDVDAIVHLAPLTSGFGDDNERLDHSTRGSYLLTEHAARAGVKCIVTASSLALFPAHLRAQFHVDSSWRPQPDTSPEQLSVWLAEVCVRETARINGISASAIRLDPAAPATSSAHALVAALPITSPAHSGGWSVVHAPEATLPAAEHAHPRQNLPRPIKNVVIFGAGGPLGAAVAEVLKPYYTLRLTDLQQIDTLLETARPQSPGAPLPVRPEPPHEWQSVDVRDPAQVRAACAGMDAAINLSVLRNVLNLAFQVNMLGARNVMSAAVDAGVHRVVHTGPFMLGAAGAPGYNWDYEIVDDVPPRPGTSWLYFMSKLCGQEMVKIYARQHGLSVPALTFCEFVNPAVSSVRPIHPLSISWTDAAHAVRAALEVETLPRPFEYFHIGTDLPHDVYVTEKAKRLLGWQPRDDLRQFFGR
jgi:nucleoside-diphosphate-sugar epimerase